MTAMIVRLAVVLVMGVAIVACSSDDDNAPDQIVTQPSAVPTDADLIEDETAIGTEAPGPDERRLANLTCSDDVIAVATTVETIYAELPCDRFVTPEIIEQFRDVTLRVTVRPGAEGAAKLVIESETRASIEFTIGHAWITEP